MCQTGDYAAYNLIKPYKTASKLKEKSSPCFLLYVEVWKQQATVNYEKGGW